MFKFRQEGKILVGCINALYRSSYRLMVSSPMKERKKKKTLCKTCDILRNSFSGNYVWWTQSLYQVPLSLNSKWSIYEFSSFRTFATFNGPEKHTRRKTYCTRGSAMEAEVVISSRKARQRNYDFTYFIST